MLVQEAAAGTGRTHVEAEPLPPTRTFGEWLLLKDRVPARSCKMTGATIVLEEDACRIWVCVRAHVHRAVTQACNYSVRSE